MVVRKLKMLPVECVVRGYITGSGWNDYQQPGAVSGIELPSGLFESQQLPEPLFTPSTKAEVGHDEAIDFERAVELAGDRDLMERVRDASLALYAAGAEHARANGIILADTKFEFGLDDDGELVIGDEVMTPDSSRYWPATTTNPAARSRRSTSSTSATGPRGPAGTSARPRPRSPARSSRARARCTSRPTSASRASSSRTGSGGRRRRARVLGGPRPASSTLRASPQRALPALGFDGVDHVHVGRLIELDVENPDQLEAMCEKARQPADRGLRGPDPRGEVRRRPLPRIVR